MAITQPQREQHTSGRYRSDHGVLAVIFFPGETMALWMMEHPVIIYGNYVKNNESVTSVEAWVSVPLQHSLQSSCSHP